MYVYTFSVYAVCSLQYAGVSYQSVYQKLFRKHIHTLKPYITSQERYICWDIPVQMIQTPVQLYICLNLLSSLSPYVVTSLGTHMLERESGNMQTYICNTAKVCT